MPGYAIIPVPIFIFICFIYRRSFVPRPASSGSVWSRCFFGDAVWRCVTVDMIHRVWRTLLRRLLVVCTLHYNCSADPAQCIPGGFFFLWKKQRAFKEEDGQELKEELSLFYHQQKFERCRLFETHHTLADTHWLVIDTWVFSARIWL